MSLDDLSKIRGLLAGLVLGDAYAVAVGPSAGRSGARRGGSRLEGEGPLRIGVASQLACFSVDALIRAPMREHDRGVPTKRAVLSWFSLRRWGRLQGLPVAEDPDASPYSAPQYDNWLSRVEALTQRRGSAPATAAALTQRLGSGSALPPAGSLGAHALIRTLPFAAAAARPEGRRWFGEGRTVAAQTHAPAAADLAELLARVAAAAWLTGSVSEGVRLAVAMGADIAGSDGVATDGVGSDGGGILHEVLSAWFQLGPGTGAFAQLPATSTAEAAVRGGLLAAMAPPAGSNMLDAFHIGALAPRPGAVLPVVGALVGAAYGIEALPQHLLARVEIADVVDDLAHDYAFTLGITASRRDLGSWYPTV
ncbi:hypothetical protein [Kineococcus rhizosphaerae]|uniref:ADP-ribosylglycohydrolase n=1 Tax=Kineococcus rhizosphaerae TaxID=559628 RepID=A0A2T0QML0_9ACTN|nr:hypothetical protein [Kineococcus rhizosphaerae]PRY05741.1 hypothetical protein CLV37_1372 [Kineococcus rhizosphaerae]